MWDILGKSNNLAATDPRQIYICSSKMPPVPSTVGEAVEAAKAKMLYWQKIFQDTVEAKSAAQPRIKATIVKYLIEGVNGTVPLLVRAAFLAEWSKAGVILMDNLIELSELCEQSPPLAARAPSSYATQSVVPMAALDAHIPASSYSDMPAKKRQVRSLSCEQHVSNALPMKLF
jgi:hypothetical protein